MRYAPSWVAVTRAQDVTWAATLAVGFVILWNRAGAQSDEKQVAAIGRAPAALAFALGGLLIVLPQLVVWNVLYGNPFSGPVPYFGQGAGNLSILPVHLWQVLVSERGGVLAWHPILALGVAGLIVARRRLGAPLFVLAFVRTSPSTFRSSSERSL